MTKNKHTSNTLVQIYYIYIYLFYVVAVCTICCVCGMAFTTRTGIYWLSLYNEVFINSCLMVLALCEVLIIVFLYGYKQ